MNAWNRLCRILGLVAILAIPAWAHRPLFSDGTHIDAGTALVIEEPDVSQVIYHEVSEEGTALWLTFDATEGDEIYLQLGVPVIDALSEYRPSLALLGPGLPEIDLPFDIPNGLGGVLLEPEGEPEVFDEPFTGTQSWILLESVRAAPATGQYYVVAFDPDDETGKLWVSIGRKEEFGIEDLFTFADVIDQVRAFHEVDDERKPPLTLFLYVIARIFSALAGLFGLGD